MQNPSKFYRFQDHRLTESRFVEWNKKRKLQPCQFDQPSSKHNCLNRTSSYGPDSLVGENPELVRIHSQGSVGQLDIIVDNYSSELESANSNSILEESDSVISMIGEETQEADCPHTTSNSNLSNGRLHKPRYTLSGLVMEKESSSKDDLGVMGDEHTSSLHDSDAVALHNLEDHLLGFGDHPDYFFSEYEHDKLEPNVATEFKDVMSTLNGANPNMFVLSSGRWSVNQEADSSKRKPTIDQEFEEYFSTLML